MSSQIQETRCPKCGDAACEHDQIGHIGDLAGWRCPSCGHQYHDLIRKMADADESGAMVRLAVRWSAGGPSETEIAAVKRFVPLLGELSADEIREELAGEPEYILGAFPKPHALALAERGRSLGLTVELEGPAPE